MWTSHRHVSDQTCRKACSQHSPEKSWETSRRRSGRAQVAKSTSSRHAQVLSNFGDGFPNSLYSQLCSSLAWCIWRNTQTQACPLCLVWVFFVARCVPSGTVDCWSHFLFSYALSYTFDDALCTPAVVDASSVWLMFSFSFACSSLDQIDVSQNGSSRGTFVCSHVLSPSPPDWVCASGSILHSFSWSSLDCFARTTLSTQDSVSSFPECNTGVVDHPSFLKLLFL